MVIRDWILGALPGALLLVGVVWAVRQSSGDRTRYVAALCRGGLVGIAAVAVLALPALLRGGAPRLLFGSSLLMRGVIAAPLGAVIGLAMTLISENEPGGGRTAG